MNNQPKVSVVIPVYNAENTLVRCINSLLDNSYENIEIILVDDCSNDSSLDICKNFNKEKIIVHHNEKNRGASYSRNKGIELSTGDYIMFVDSDDWVDSEYVLSFVELINCENGLIVSGYYNHDESNSGVLSMIKPTESDLMFLYNNTLLQQLWNKIFDAKVIKKHSICFDEKLVIGEDFDFILNYLEVINNTKIMTIEKCLYHYMRDQKNSLMYNVKPDSVKISLMNLRHLYRISGMSNEEIGYNMRNEKQKVIDVNAYLIMHNKGVSLVDKRKMILELAEGDKRLWKKNFILYLKENIKRII